MADIIGRRFGTKKIPYNKDKSFAGSIAMAAAGFIASVGYMHYFSMFGYFEESWEMIFGFLVISVASALVESHPISTTFDDNLMVPLTSLVAMPLQALCNSYKCNFYSLLQVLSMKNATEFLLLFLSRMRQGATMRQKRKIKKTIMTTKAMISPSIPPELDHLENPLPLETVNGSILISCKAGGPLNQPLYLPVGCSSRSHLVCSLGGAPLGYY
nr:probable phytol kinase 3, chloroplastic [Tanacetum cinerariifolium]